MATFKAEVEVFVSDFPDNIVIEHVRAKMKKNIGFATKMKKELSLSVINLKLPVDSISDKMKLEFIQDNWEKITLDKLENCIK